MEEKPNKYETKIEKLTFFRILIVFLCEILFEFSFGLFFFLFSEYEGYYREGCIELLFWTKTIWKLYLAEFTVAFICFFIGILSLFCYNRKLTKVYVAFNNFFKSIIFFASIIILTIVFMIYKSERDACDQLGELTFYWLIFHFSLLGFACIAALTILVVTFLFYKKRKNKVEAHDYISLGINN